MAEAGAWIPGRTRFSPGRDLAPGRVFAGRGFAMPLAAAWGRRRCIPCGPPPRGPDPGAGTLVTGGAGFLGRHVVAALLGDPRRGPVTVASRDPSGARRALEAAVGPVEAARIAGGDRLRTLAVDLSLPDAAERIAEGVRGPVGVVHHLAAAVDAFAGRGVLEGANVAATLSAVGAAGRLGAALVHASTLSVFVSSNGGGEAHEDWLGDDPGTLLYGGYAQTKAMAEAVVAAAAAGGLAARVVRYGLLVPAHGRDLPPGHFLRTFLGGLAAVGAVPGAAEDAAVDLTRVDLAAAAAVAIGDAPGGGVFHYANPAPASLGDVVAALARARGAGFRAVDGLEWDRIVAEAGSLPGALLDAGFRKSAHLARSARGPVLNLDLFQATGRAFGIGRSLAVGAPAPEPPTALLARLAAPFSGPMVT